MEDTTLLMLLENQQIYNDNVLDAEISMPDKFKEISLNLVKTVIPQIADLVGNLTAMYNPVEGTTTAKTHTLPQVKWNEYYFDDSNFPYMIFESYKELLARDYCYKYDYKSIDLAMYVPFTVTSALKETGFFPSLMTRFYAKHK